MDPVILIFAIVAAFFIYKLLSALGENSGEPDNASDARKEIEALRRTLSGNRDQSQSDETSEPETAYAEPAQTPEPVRATSPKVREIVDADPSFSEEGFLEGAKAAYEMIVEAFAKGDLKPVKPYVAESVLKAFKDAVAVRESQGHVSDLQFIGIEKASIVEGRVSPETLTVVADFVSDQVRVTRDKDGNVVDGDPNRIDLVKDRWTFARKRHANDPNWALVATGVAR